VAAGDKIEQIRIPRKIAYDAWENKHGRKWWDVEFDEDTSADTNNGHKRNATEICSACMKVKSDDD
jgi:hypothetical protein